MLVLLLLLMLLLLLLGASSEIPTQKGAVEHRIGNPVFYAGFRDRDTDFPTRTDLFLS